MTVLDLNTLSFNLVFRFSNSRADELFWTKARFLEEIDALEKHFNSFSFEIVFSHLDGWVNNVVYDKEKGLYPKSFYNMFQ